ncbi:hypothetical protein B0T19DRAFT_472730 [Cercophora scortea]|uniref:Azaphilone pigments biosynthesis cluster protein L N-terminal domain-containing protein n=1 Tax=Cercophora scortea TaxID=314031 RepID=A0AAE0IUS4_9PEZI|nr:hypothetical protein B0T19DRAFT_472730 [Cercophora scortea]
MDPLTIVSTCFSLAGSIVSTTKAITSFASEAKDARGDLARLEKELEALRPVLDTIAQSISSGEISANQPASMLDQLRTILDGCAETVKEIEAKIAGYAAQNKARRSMTWALYGREDMDKLRRDLEGYRSALGIGLHVLNITLNVQIKTDTEHIRGTMDNLVLCHDDLVEMTALLRSQLRSPDDQRGGLEELQEPDQTDPTSPGSARVLHKIMITTGRRDYAIWQRAVAPPWSFDGA